jgi:hypothetical protein
MIRIQLVVLSVSLLLSNVALTCGPAWWDCGQFRHHPHPHPQAISVETTLDKGNPTVRISGKSYRWVLGSAEARDTKLRPAGQPNPVTLEGYFKVVGIENVFVITSIVMSIEN